MSEDLPGGASLPDYVGEGRPADHAQAVLYQGPWETLEDGTCRAVRMNARALREAGVPVVLQSYAHHVNVSGVLRSVLDVDLDEEVLQQVRGMHQASATRLGPVIRHLVALRPEDVRAQLNHPRMLPPGATVDQLRALRQMMADSTVLYTVWERDRIDPQMAAELSRAGQCWVPCRQNADMLIASGVPPHKVYVVPHPYDPKSFLATSGLHRFTGWSRRFYSMGAWQPRKGFHELLGAFLLEFRESEPASLTLKFSPHDFPGYPSAEQSVRHWLTDPQVLSNGWTLPKLSGRVRLLTRRLTESEVENLHLTHNIYVSASHGEAWGLPAFDAKVAGNVLCHVPYGGTADFAEDSDVKVDYELGAVSEQYAWGDSTQWANYSIDALRRALRRAPLRPPRRSPEFEERFGLKSVGQHMAILLRDLYKKVHGEEAANYLKVWGNSGASL